MTKRYVIVATSPKTGRRLHLTTRGVLSDSGRSRKFSSVEDAWRVGEKLLRSNSFLRDYHLRAESLRPVNRRNPSGYAKARDAYLAEIDKAAESFETFTGHKASKEIRFSNRPVRAGFALGPLVSVTYEQNRLGDGLSHYKHEFKKSSRPLLVSSVDGEQLVIVGGRFKVSDRVGIEDK